MSQDKTEAVWSICSVEIEDRQMFIDLVVTKLGDLFDWYLEEIKS